MQQALPDVFTRTGTVATTWNKILTRLGDVTAYANDPKNNILGMNISQWSVAGNTLYEAMQSFKNHTNNLAGVNTDNRLIIGRELYGNVHIGGSVNIASTNVATANLSKTSYPVVNVGSTIVVNGASYIVTGKQFTTHGSGTVSVDITTNNVRVTTASVATLNLADVSLSGTSTIKLSPGMYINVNSEIKLIDTINAYGDFLTVTRPFRNSNTSSSLGKETALVVNTNFTSTNTDISVYRKDAFIANSVCLDNVITGNGTSFATQLSVDDKIYYDDLEYFVIAVTNTTITVDAPLRSKQNMVVYKISNEMFVNQLTEPYGAEDVLSDFSLANQLYNGLTNTDGSSFMSDFSTKYRASNGQYTSVSVYNPTYVTKSLENGPAYMAAVNKTVQGLVDDLQNDAIRYLSDNELTLYLEAKLTELDNLRSNLNDSIQQDLAAINAVKGLLKGLLKLWNASCSKKKRGAEDFDETDNEYLDSILVPNPIRQGCDATTSDLPELLDQTDEELTTPENEPVAPENPIPEPDPDPALFETDPNALYVLERQRASGNTSDIVIDDDPESQLPAKTEDPCVKPC